MECSFHWPHCTNSPAASLQASSEERRKCKLELLIAHTAPKVAEILLWPPAELQPILTQPGWRPWYFPKNSFCKSKQKSFVSWHCLLLPCKLCHTASGAGVRVAHTPETRRELCRSSLFHQHISQLLIFAVYPNAFMALGQAPQSSLKQRNLTL